MLAMMAHYEIITTANVIRRVYKMREEEEHEGMRKVQIKIVLFSSCPTSSATNVATNKLRTIICVPSPSLRSVINDSNARASQN